MRRRFKNTLLIICFMLIASLALGGFYYTYKENKKSPYVKVSGPLSVNFLTGNHVVVNGSKTVDISIINDSNEDAYYYIEFKNLRNINDATYTIINSKDENITDTLNPYNSIVSSYILIEAGAKEDYQISFNSKSKEEYSLDIDINTENIEINTFADVILKNNPAKVSPLTKVGEEIATEDEGLIMASDENGTSYYFRGNIGSNYVNINDHLFRIVRINGDGSVKLVYNDVAEQLNKYYEDFSDYTFASSYFNTYLSSWAVSMLGEYKNNVATYKYCNDFVTDGDLFVASKRIKTDNIPSLHCLGEKISAKAGLLTADEVIYAGAVYNVVNNSFYLYNSNITNNSYLMTSASKTYNTYSPFVLSSDGRLSEEVGTTVLGVRPVITINKTTTIASGDGSVNNPYILKNGA